MLGVLLPGLPTTEFVLLAAWAASRSSPRLSAWLDNHRLFGPLLRDWRNGGVVSRRSKLLASGGVCCSRHGLWSAVDLVATGTTQIAVLSQRAAKHCS